MFLAVVSDSFSRDETGVADGFCDYEKTKVALREIAERIEIEHLAVDVEKRVLSAIGGGGLADDHAGSVGALCADIRGHAACASKRSKIDDGVNNVGANTTEEKNANEKGEEAFHKGESG